MSISNVKECTSRNPPLVCCSLALTTVAILITVGGWYLVNFDVSILNFISQLRGCQQCKIESMQAQTILDSDQGRCSRKMNSLNIFASYFRYFKQPIWLSSEFGGHSCYDLFVQRQSNDSRGTYARRTLVVISRLKLSPNFQEAIIYWYNTNHSLDSSKNIHLNAKSLMSSLRWTA